MIFHTFLLCTLLLLQYAAGVPYSRYQDITLCDTTSQAATLNATSLVAAPGGGSLTTLHRAVGIEGNHYDDFGRGLLQLESGELIVSATAVQGTAGAIYRIKLADPSNIHSITSVSEISSISTPKNIPTPEMKIFGCAFGTDFASLGDVNGDGQEDLLVSAKEDSGDSESGGGIDGSVWIIYLDSDSSFVGYDKISSTRGGLLEANGGERALSAGDHFGEQIGVVGDLDSDGTVDIVVTSNDQENLPVSRGALYVIFLTSLGDNMLSDALSGIVVKSFIKLCGAKPENFDVGVVFDDIFPEFTTFGVLRGIAIGDDFDNDGYQDILYSMDTFGTLALLNLNAQGKGQSYVSLGNAPSEKYYNSVAILGDIDGNGQGDIIAANHHWEHGNSIDIIFMSSVDSFTVLTYYTLDQTILPWDMELLEWPFSAQWQGFVTHIKPMTYTIQEDGLVNVIMGVTGGMYPNLVDRDDGSQYVIQMPIIVCNCTGTAFIGPLCQEECLNGGLNDGSSFTQCNCDGTNAVGDLCEHPCLNGGVLSANSRDLCDCSGTDFIGVYCEIPCENGGVELEGQSVTTGGWTQCDCTNAPHFFGSACDKPCYNGVHDSTWESCNCTGSGATGSKCTKDIDDCVSSPCQNHGVCTDNGDTLFPYHAHEFNCSCEDTGYQGALCEISDCVSSPCLNNGLCELTVSETRSTVVCNCSLTGGFEGEYCQTEVDECSSSPCEHNAECIDLTDGFYCECGGTGFQGVTCSDEVDDCTSSPCQNNGVCKDKTNSFQCTCNDYWEGATCTDNVDDCLLTVNECLNGGACTDDPVYLGDVICDCSTSTGDFTGKYCDVPIEDACVTYNPCFHGGKCVVDDITKEMSCDCANTGYEGDVCDIELYNSECIDSTCSNEGQCYDPSDEQDNWYCVCTNGYSGKTCDFRACDSDPCENGGTCSNTEEGGYTCTCAENYAGVHCEVNDNSQQAAISSSSSSGAPSAETSQDQASQVDKSNDGDTQSLLIIVVVLVVLIAGVGGIYCYRKQRLDDGKFVMPT